MIVKVHMTSDEVQPSVQIVGPDGELVDEMEPAEDEE